jgi:hypothetical protein
MHDDIPEASFNLAQPQTSQSTPLDSERRVGETTRTFCRVDSQDDFQALLHPSNLASGLNGGRSRRGACVGAGHR